MSWVVLMYFSQDCVLTFFFSGMMEKNNSSSCSYKSLTCRFQINLQRLQKKKQVYVQVKQTVTAKHHQLWVSTPVTLSTPALSSDSRMTCRGQEAMQKKKSSFPSHLTFSSSKNSYQKIHLVMEMHVTSSMQNFCLMYRATFLSIIVNYQVK